MNQHLPIVDDHVFLIGRPPIGGFIRFVKTRTTHGQQADEEALVREWRRARDHIRDLETAEKDYADCCEMPPLPDDMAPLAEAELQHAALRRASRIVPRSWRIVEADKIVVFQKMINLSFVDEIKAALPTVPAHDDLIRLAVGKGWSPPAVQVGQPSDGTFCFISRSDDIRFLDVVPLSPSCLRDYEPSGRPSNVIGVFVGFGVNLISALHVRNRLILTNGSHRLYALRALGVTHVPCLVTHVTNEEEFEFVAPPEVKQNPERYFKVPRPALLKDYFDKRLRMVLPVYRRHQLLQLKLSFETSSIPAI